jgi:hypothetical protein
MGIINFAFWGILGIFWVICLIGATTDFDKIIASIWLAAISIMFVIDASITKLLTALKEHIKKEE